MSSKPLSKKTNFSVFPYSDVCFCSGEIMSLCCRSQEKNSFNNIHLAEFLYSASIVNILNNFDSQKESRVSEPKEVQHKGQVISYQNLLEIETKGECLDSNQNDNSNNQECLEITSPCDNKVKTEYLEIEGFSDYLVHNLNDNSTAINTQEGNLFGSNPKTNLGNSAVIFNDFSSFIGKQQEETKDFTPLLAKEFTIFNNFAAQTNSLLGKKRNNPTNESEEDQRKIKGFCIENTLSPELPTLTESSQHDYNKFEISLDSCLGLEEEPDDWPKKKKEIFKIEKREKNAEILLTSRDSAISTNDSIVCLNLEKSYILTNECETEHAKQNRKFDIDSINKKIRTDVFNCLGKIISNKELFTQELKIDANIENNKKLNEKTIPEIIEDELRKDSQNEEIVQEKLSLIINKEGIDKDIFDLTFRKFYEKYYISGKMFETKLNLVKNKESEEYRRRFEFRLKDYIAYYNQTNGNKKWSS